MASGSQHVCVVAWAFPPVPGAVSVRALAIANAAATAGHQVSVVTITREPLVVHYGIDEELQRQVDPRVEVIRVPFFPESAWPLVNDWRRVRADDPARYEAMAARVELPFPEQDTATWLSRAGQALFQLHHRKPIGLLVGSGPPHVALEAAAATAANERIPLVLDGADSFLQPRVPAPAATGPAAGAAAPLDVAATGDPATAQRADIARRWAGAAAALWCALPDPAGALRVRFPEASDRILTVADAEVEAAVTRVLAVMPA